MALRTFGSTTTSVLRAVQWTPAMAAVGHPDLAAFNNSINLINPANVLVPATNVVISANGILYLPNGNGRIQLNPNDWAVFDVATGQPFVVPNWAVAVGGSHWVHS